MLKLLSNKGVSIQTSPSEFVRGSGGVSVLEKATGKVVMGIVAPSEKNLVTWLKAHPSYQVLLPAGKGMYMYMCSPISTYIPCKVMHSLHVRYMHIESLPHKAEPEK